METTEEECFFCHCADGLSRCDECEVVSYCDRHRGVHRPAGVACLPFRVATDAAFGGRVLVASRDVAVAEVAVLDRALVILPDLEPVCLGCFADVDGNSRCGRCSFPMCGAASCPTELHGEAECGPFAAAAVHKLVNGPDAKATRFVYNAVGILRFLVAQRKSQAEGSIWAEEMGKLQSHSQERYVLYES